MKKVILASYFTITMCSGHDTFAADSAANQALATAPNVNCSYHIAANEHNIDPNLIKYWARNAAVQAFSYDPGTIDQQLLDLKACFTDQGYIGFKDAMQKSGNIETIKAQQLKVSSEAKQTIELSVLKNNQWKSTVNILVTYQNAKTNMSQAMHIDLLIGRKSSGDLGIMQMIATAQPAKQEPNNRPS